MSSPEQDETGSIKNFECPGKKPMPDAAWWKEGQRNSGSAIKFASFFFTNSNWVPPVRWWDIVWSGEPKQRSTTRLGEHHIWCVRLGTSSQCLLLTGPNAGGKTVVLKTLGLLALLVCISVAVVGGIDGGPLSGGVCFFFFAGLLFEARCGIPIPGGEAPRVDFFEALTSTSGCGKRETCWFCY